MPDFGVVWARVHLNTLRIIADQVKYKCHAKDVLFTDTNN